MENNFPGADDSCLIGEFSPDNNWCVTFEDDGRTGYMYICAVKEDGTHGEILDHLWIYNQIKPPIRECKEVFILWSDDSLKAGLIVDEECWGIFDLKSWRKINAPREGNAIRSLPLDVWENVLESNEGEPMKTNNIN